MTQSFMRKTSLFFITLVVLLIFPIILTQSATFAEEGVKGTGTILGKLVDKDGNPESGVLVTAISFAGIETDEMKFQLYFNEGRLPEVRTDKEGHFKIDNIPLGKWALKTKKGPLGSGSFIRVHSGEDSEDSIVLIVNTEMDRIVNVGNVLLSRN